MSYIKANGVSVENLKVYAIKVFKFLFILFFECVCAHLLPTKSWRSMILLENKK